MSNEVFQELKNLNVATVVALVILTVVSLKFLDPVYNKIKNYIINKYKKDVKEKTTDDTLLELKERMAKYEENRINDRAQSFKIQKELTDSISSLRDELQNLKKSTEEHFKDSKERSDKRVRAELKDRIAQSYRYYNHTKRWTVVDKEALEDLIEAYELAGGENSFVHSKVQKEMYTWELVDND